MTTLLGILIGAALFAVYALVGNRGCNGRCAGCTGACERFDIEGDRHV